MSRSEAAELARQMMLAADIDGDGQIEFEEFSAVLKRSRAELEAQESDAAGRGCFLRASRRPAVTSDPSFDRVPSSGGPA